VGWCLTAEHTDGDFPRKGVPYYDENGEAIGIGNVTPETLHNGYFLDLESEEPRQLLTDWFNNSYRMTHGHMCPAADNKWSKAAMNQSFLLTNMCPQDGTLNGGAWQKLEDKCRTWARQYKEIYIVAGPLYDNGKVSRTIGNSKVAVPDAFFKVVLCLTGTPKAIAFIYRNDKSSQNMRDAACSVDAIESITGLDFFSSLPDDIESEIESQTNFNAW
jgi:endonuclease G